jgi:hypothetical protein
MAEELSMVVQSTGESPRKPLQNSRFPASGSVNSPGKKNPAIGGVLLFVADAPA